jgi:hypothetical protein
MAASMTSLTGSCHCGDISYRLNWPEKPARVPARRCSCTFCTRIDGAWTSHPGAELRIGRARDGAFSRYRFGTNTADFIFCGRCGITLFALCEIEGRTKAVLNTHTLKPGQDFSLDPSDSCFDGESKGARLARRNERWIGRVEIA